MTLVFTLLCRGLVIKYQFVLLAGSIWEQESHRIDEPTFGIHDRPALLSWVNPLARTTSRCVAMC